MQTEAAPKRPAFRYYGGKWRLASWIISHFPKHRVYVEPFGGAASVLLRKPRSYAEIYNDLDSEVVNVFQVLRDPAQAAELEYLLRLTPFSRDDFNAAYQPCADPIEQARRTIYKSFAGYGSDSIHRRKASSSGFKFWEHTNVLNAPTGFRCDANRSGTTPAHDWAHYPDHLHSFIERLQGMVILSAYPSELYEQLFRDWRKYERKSSSQNGDPGKEVLWISPNVPEKQGELFEGDCHERT